eukprot:scaffold35527_cov35-Prasinocladus_malaysianus.AAC.3
MAPCWEAKAATCVPLVLSDAEEAHTCESAARRLCRYGSSVVRRHSEGSLEHELRDAEAWLQEGAANEESWPVAGFSEKKAADAEPAVMSKAAEPQPEELANRAARAEQ